MPIDYDIIIVGAGLAGTCSALHLSGTERVLLVDSHDPPAGASAAAAGLVNPFMARKARAAWRHREALTALERTLDLAGASACYRQSGVLRPARDTQQEALFRKTASIHPECRWLPARECRAEYPEVAAPFGSLRIDDGGAVDIPRFIDEAVVHLRRSGVSVSLSCTLTELTEDDGGVDVVLKGQDGMQHLRAGSLLLACGAGFRSLRVLDGLGLHAVKGQTVDVAPKAPLHHLPHIAGAGYVVMGDSRITIGSSYEHEFEDVDPDPEVTRRMLTRAASMVPSLRGSPVVAERAGLRVTVRGHRMPIVGPLPGWRRIWTFTGLGSKGLLLAPLIASELPGYLGAADRIPAPIRIRR